MLSGEFNWEDARRALLAYGEEIGFQKGMREGMAKGVEKGVQEGIEREIEREMERGMERGIEQERRAMALRLRGYPLDMSAVVYITGLGEDEIRQLWYHVPDSPLEFPNI